MVYLLGYVRHRGVHISPAFRLRLVDRNLAVVFGPYRQVPWTPLRLQGVGALGDIHHDLLWDSRLYHKVMVVDLENLRCHAKTWHLAAGIHLFHEEDHKRPSSDLAA